MFTDKSVFVDVETTGGNANRDRITEVAIITMQEGKVTEEWSVLINPLTRIPEYIQKLTGINEEMVSNAATFETLANDIYARLSGSVFIAHNARFDYGFLKNEFKRCGITFRAPVLCTVKLSRKLFPIYKRHNLDSIMQRHELSCEARHRALGDAKVLYQFLQTIYKDKNNEEINKVIQNLLKRPSLPSGLSEEQIDSLPETAGVYRFYDKDGVLLYTGKSINIRERVLSHFANDHSNSKDMKISQNISSIDFVESAGELGALLLEARLIKNELPVYNQRLRRYDSLTSIFWDMHDEKSIPEIITATTLDTRQINKHYGLFKTKKKAIEKLRELAKAHNLCEKKLGLEKGKGACFAYQIKKCNGVCVGEETIIKHRMRLLEALQPLRNQVWPFDGRVGVRESSPDCKRIDIHLFEDWCYLGTAHDESELHQINIFEQHKPMFDIDTYRILSSYLNKTKHPDILKIKTYA